MAIKWKFDMNIPIIKANVRRGIVLIHVLIAQPVYRRQYIENDGARLILR